MDQNFYEILQKRYEKYGNVNEKIGIRVVENSNTFSVASYNTLADCYSPFLDYCDERFLSFDYRKEILADEIRRFDSDFICLQEVDKYHEFFKIVLDQIHYESYYFKRPTDLKSDGSLIAWKVEKWKILESKELDYNFPEQPLIDPAYLKHNIGLLIVFENLATGEKVLIGTSHFFWDPKFEHVKFLQAKTYMENGYILKEKFQCEVVLTGDLNSIPGSNVINFMSNKPLDFEKTTENDAEIQNMYEPSQLKMRSSYEEYSPEGFPDFTNYTPRYLRTIDHIFCSEGILTVSLGKVPSTQDFQGLIGIPNEYFPSDHLPLIAEFAIIPK